VDKCRVGRDVGWKLQVIKNGGQIFYACNIFMNVDVEIGEEVKDCRLPGGGCCKQSGIRYYKQLRLDKTLKIYLVTGCWTRITNKDSLRRIHQCEKCVGVKMEAGYHDFKEKISKSVFLMIKYFY
jgi:hypothetical protein